MKAITITAWRRAEYLEQVLESVGRAEGHEAYHVWIGLEPGPPEVLEVTRAAQAGGYGLRCPVTVLPNAERLGHIHNPKQLLARVFEAERAEAVVYLEEDTVVAQDALRLADWYAGHPSRDDYLCLNLFNFRSATFPPEDPRYRTLVPYACDYQPVPFACPWNSLGCVFTPAGWETIRPLFDKPDPTNSWNWRVYRLWYARPGLRTLHPLLSRANHVGRTGGVFCPEDYNDQHFAGHPVATHVPAGDYRIE